MSTVPGFSIHDGDDDVAQRLHVRLAAAIAHVREPAGGHAVGAAVLRSLRAHDAHALLHVGGGATVGEQDAVEARPDRALREEAPRLLVDLELHRHVVDVPGAREVVEVVEVEGTVLSDELDVVVETRVPDRLHDGRPRGVNVGGQRGLVGLQELAQLVGSHGVLSYRFQPSQSHTARPITSSRSRPFSQGSSSVNSVTHWRHEHGMRVMSVPQNQRAGPKAS